MERSGRALADVRHGGSLMATYWGGQALTSSQTSKAPKPEVPRVRQPGVDGRLPPPGRRSGRGKRGGSKYLQRVPLPS